MSIKYLVIVESPSKIKKIQEYLGKEYVVKASFGHITNLDPKTLSIDIKTLLPKYHIMKDKTKVVKELKELSKKYEVILAADNDTEGESIAFHLSNILKLKNPKRIIFNEITKKALTKAIQNPVEININKVNNQQTRRVTDRLIGYLLTPIAWNNINNTNKSDSISVGRVQSIVLRLICDKENDINNFKTNKNYIVSVTLTNNINLIAKLKETNLITTREQVIKLITKGSKNNFMLDDIKKTKLTNNPPPPFCTSSLQQEANVKYSYSSKNTMLYAQKLYENGLITYMRTDSVNLCEDILIELHKYIVDNFGEEYYKKRTYTKKSTGKEELSHEAIRPTNLNFNYNNIPDEFQRKLYKLILKRTVASQMESNINDEYSYNFKICNYGKYNFIYKISKVVFDGYKKIYVEQVIKDSNEDDEDTNNKYSSKLKNIKIGDIFKLKELNAIEKYKNPPPRYTEGSLIKQLDKIGIGRPSTYSIMLSSILSKKYVYVGDYEGNKVNVQEITFKDDNITDKNIEKIFGAEKKKILLTDLGENVNKFIIDNFTELINYDFTKLMEEQLDLIEQGKIDWLKITKKYYNNIISITKNMKSNNNNNNDNNDSHVQLGFNPDNNNKIVKYVGKYGPVAREELGNNQYKYANITTNFNDFTLENAIQLLKYPYTIFNYNDKPVVICNGQYGVYFKYNDKNYNLKNYDENKLTLDIIQNIIDSSNSGNSSVIKKINDSVSVLNGQYGAYIHTKKGNYKIPSNYDPEQIDLNICKEIIKNKPKKTYKKK